MKPPDSIIEDGTIYKNMTRLKKQMKLKK